jgi:hypothetical protein
MSKASRQTTKQNRSTSTSTDPSSKGDQTLKATDQATQQVQPEKKLITEQTSQSNPKQLTRQAAKYERRREEQRRREAEKQHAIQKRRFTILGGIIAAVLILSVVGYFMYTGYLHPAHNAVTSATPVPTIVNPDFPPVDNVYCDTLEQTASHYHVLLSIYINGKSVPVATQVGIAPDVSCYYWLHTHDSSGIVHIEAPANRTFTLGNFLDIWGQRFSSLQYPPQLDQPGGPGWQIFVDGKLVGGDFHNIVLKPHEFITIAYNTPNVTPITTYNWNGL